MNSFRVIFRYAAGRTLLQKKIHRSDGDRNKPMAKNSLPWRNANKHRHSSGTVKVSRDHRAMDLKAKVYCAGNRSTVGENRGAEGRT